MKTVLRAFFVSMCVLGASGCAETIDASAEADVSASSEDLREVCALVLCALPDCGPNQTISLRGGCCPVCVGAPSRCATVLCAAVECPEGQQLETSPGDCCGHCVPAHRVQECRTTDECPVFDCIQCPCPTSECRGGQCVTTTPDESTCPSSGDLL